MSDKLFVGGLSWGTTDDSLRDAFEAIGPVLEAKVITDRDTGRSRGFGFVTMDSPSSAQEAIQQLDGTSLDGRSIKVNIAEAKASKGPRSGGRNNDRRW